MRTDLPIYIATGELDPVNGQLALVNALVDRYTAAGLTDVTLKVYPQARHEIFNETNRDTVVDDLLTWLDQSSALDGAASATRGGAGRQTGKRRGTGEGAHVRPRISVGLGFRLPSTAESEV